jgi:hypothetical protein
MRWNAASEISQEFLVSRFMFGFSILDRDLDGSGQRGHLLTHTLLSVGRRAFFSFSPAWSRISPNGVFSAFSLKTGALGAPYSAFDKALGVLGPE